MINNNKTNIFADHIYIMYCHTVYNNALLSFNQIANIKSFDYKIYIC